MAPRDLIVKLEILNCTQDKAKKTSGDSTQIDHKMVQNTASGILSPLNHLQVGYLASPLVQYLTKQAGIIKYPEGKLLGFFAEISLFSH